MISVREIDHVVLRVVDLDAALSFYVNVLGCSIEKSQDKLDLIQLRAGASLIDLVPVDGELGSKGGAAPGEQRHNMDHFCLRVEPFEEQCILDHLTRHGIAAVSAL